MWAAGAAIGTGEAALSSAVSWLLLACGAAVLLDARGMMIYGILCSVGTATLIAHVYERTGDDAILEPGLVATVFVPTGFAVLGRVAQLVRTTIGHLEDAEQEAREALEAHGRFLANMSHELRTPLNAILGYSELLAEELEPGQQASHDVRRIWRSGRHLLAHIDTLLDFSKLEAGHTELHLEEVDLTSLIEDVRADYRPLLLARGNESIADLQAGLKLVVDVHKLRQILTNLTSNANKFTENGVITYRTRLDDDIVQIDVVDTGVGIAPEAQALVFSPFVQADSSTTRKYGGTGLGLALVHGFTSLMGGEVALESSPGQGSCFRVRLPQRVAC